MTNILTAGYEEHVSEAYYELGKSEIVAGNVKEALKQFSKCLAVMEKIPNPLGICRAHNQLALAYKVIGDDKNVLDHLQKSKDNAAEFGLPLQEAKAYFLTGEYYLDRENPKEATPNLEQAFSLYNSHGAKEEANRARCLTGVARGQEMMGAYLALIMKSVQGDVEATMKICRWKDRGEPFQGITINEGISEEEAE